MDDLTMDEIIVRPGAVLIACDLCTYRDYCDRDVSGPERARDILTGHYAKHHYLAWLERRSRTCECFGVPPEQWTTYGDSTEPGSMVEQNPDCPVHPA